MSATQSNPHAEAFVLAAALAPQWFDDIVRAVPQPEMFDDGRNRDMYAAIIALHTSGSGVDATTLQTELRRRDAVGNAPTQWTPERIATFVNATPSEMLNYATHAEEVRAQWVRREVIRTARMATIAAMDQQADAHDALDSAQAGLASIAECATRTTPPDLRTIARSASEMIATNRVRMHQGGIVGVPSGIDCLDRRTFGWIAPRLVIVGARTSIGKTAFLFTSVSNAVAAGYGCAVYSWEEEPKMLFIRLAAIRARVNGQHAIAGQLNDSDQAKLDDAMGALEFAPLELIDATGWNALDVRAHARSLKRRMPSLAMVGVDYIQKMRPIESKKDIRLQIGQTSSTLFHFAHDSNLVILGLAQLNRMAQARHDKKPEQSDLKESGDLEQDADSIVLIHRPEYDGIDCWDGNEADPCENQARLLLPKHRGGATYPSGKELTVAYHKQWAEFADLDPDRNAPTTMPTNAPSRYGSDW